MQPLPSLRSSALANYLGQGWSALMGIAFLPLYLAVLGVEAYALIGFFAVLQAWVGLLDLGLTPTLNREMARLRGGLHTAGSIRDLLRSLEWICVGVVLLAVAVVWSAAPWLASRWLNLQHLPMADVLEALRIMAFVLATRFVEQVYRGALQGAGDQIWLNLATAGLATLRWGGALLVITVGAPSIANFFVWQGAVSCVSVAVLVTRTYQILPPSTRYGQFRIEAMADVYGFARGMFVGSILAFLLTQVDKLAVSKMLPLTELGYYTLAAAVAGSLMQLVVPLNTAVYPRLTMQVSQKDDAGLRATYHRTCEWMAAIVVPPALVLACFPDLVLLAWTGDDMLVEHVAPLLTILAIGNLCNAFMNIPYMLQLAHGWTGLAIRVNLVAVLLFLPAVLWAVPKFGASGAAFTWLALNLSYLTLVAGLMYSRILPGAQWKWYRDAVIRPVAAGAVVAGVLRLLLPDDPSRIFSGIFVAGGLVAMIVAVLAATPSVRLSIFQAFHERRAAPGI